MSRDANIELDWAGGANVFRLGLSEIEKVQEACDAGPQFIYHRLASGTWLVSDLRSPILWGLVGGGMSIVDAQKAVKTYFIPPLAQHILVAQSILGACLVGAKDEDETDETQNPKE